MGGMGVVLINGLFRTCGMPFGIIAELVCASLFAIGVSSWARKLASRRDAATNSGFPLTPSPSLSLLSFRVSFEHSNHTGH